MTAIRLLFHVHTRSSFDGVMSPLSIIAFCKRRNIHALAITDHDSDASLDLAADLAHDAGVFLIPAVEYNSTDGDVVGLFCRGAIPQQSGNETIRTIKDRGGIVVLPHPAKGHQLDNIDVSEVDIIEVFNARCDAAANQAAQELASRYCKPVIAGADAHLPWDLSTCVNELTLDGPAQNLTAESVREALLRGPRPIVDHASPYLSIATSQMVKAVKQRRPKLFVRQFLSLGKHYVIKPVLGRGGHG